MQAQANITKQVTLVSGQIDLVPPNNASGSGVQSAAWFAIKAVLKVHLPNAQFELSTHTVLGDAAGWEFALDAGSVGAPWRFEIGERTLTARDVALCVVQNTESCSIERHPPPVPTVGRPHYLGTGTTWGLLNPNNSIKH